MLGVRSGTMFEDSNSDVIIERLGEIRKRRRFTWIVLFLYMPVVLLASALFGDVVTPYVAFSWMGFFVFAGARVDWCRCPRCGEKFHSARYWHNPWTRKCLHCKLPLRGYEHSV